MRERAGRRPRQEIFRPITVVSKNYTPVTPESQLIYWKAQLKKRQDRVPTSGGKEILIVFCAEALMDEIATEVNAGRPVSSELLLKFEGALKNCDAAFDRLGL